MKHCGNKFALVALLLASSAGCAQTMQEANQGVATERDFFYAIADHDIGKYSKQTGKRVAQWHGEPPAFIHINSCSAVGTELVCAMSNFPGVPMISSVERFDRATLRHTGTHALGPGRRQAATAPTKAVPVSSCMKTARARSRPWFADLD